MLFRPRNLPRDITSYDLLKTVALLLMIVDHVGYYFFPDDNWWRVFGRMCVPIWFFLIGYARSRDLGAPLWIGMIVLVAANMVAGMSVFPLNILATILTVRLVIDRLAAHMRKGAHEFWAVNVLLLLLALPTSAAMEYGTLAVILALFGYFLRARQDGDAALTADHMQKQMLFAVVAFCILQTLTFGFGQAQMIVLGIGIVFVYMVLMFFRPVTFAGTGRGLWRVPGTLLHLTGRHTLALYVWHLLLFKALGVLYFGERFSLWDWNWLS